jgi:hypothetical protein
LENSPNDEQTSFGAKKKDNNAKASPHGAKKSYSTTLTKGEHFHVQKIDWNVYHFVMS